MERITLQEAVTRVPLGYSTLRRKIACGELPAERVGRRILIRAADLDALTAPVVGHPADHGAIDRAVKRVVAAAPCLTADQRRHLAIALGGAS